MYSHWITSFVETFTNVGKGWQSYSKLSHTQTEVIDNAYEELMK